VLKVVDKMANKLVAPLATISVPEMGEDLPLKYWLVVAIALCSEDFESQVLVLIVVPASLK
jgi:hypothetical protein